MKYHTRKVLDLLKRIHASEQGAEGLEKLLIIAAIVLPLLGLLIVLRGYISQWVSTNWNTVQSDSQTPLTNPNAPG